MEKKYSAIYQYTKTVNGLTIPIAKTLDPNLFDSLDEAIEACMRYYKSHDKTELSQFHISEWGCSTWNDNYEGIPVKINEFSIMDLCK